MSDVLANIMHFAIAMIVMCRYSVSKTSAALYCRHLEAHMDGLKILFPGFGVPSYHISLHIYDFLLLLGPVRSWWCYPFERLIGKLQRMLHNHRYGMCQHPSRSRVLTRKCRSAGRDSPSNVVEGISFTPMAWSSGCAGANEALLSDFLQDLWRHRL